MHRPEAALTAGAVSMTAVKIIIEIKYNHYILATWAVDCFNAALCLDIYIYLQHYANPRPIPFIARAVL